LRATSDGERMSPDPSSIVTGEVGLDVAASAPFVAAGVLALALASASELRMSERDSSLMTKRGRFLLLDDDDDELYEYADEKDAADDALLEFLCAWPWLKLELEASLIVKGEEEAPNEDGEKAAEYW